MKVKEKFALSKAIRSVPICMIVLMYATLVRTGEVGKQAVSTYGIGIPKEITQEKKIQGPIIKLEEEEITLFDEKGKVTRKIYVSSLEEDEEKEMIWNYVKQKVLQKLEVKSLEEVEEKKLWKRYNEERDKLVKIKPLEHQRLKFIDEKGKVIKEISLQPQIKIEEEEVIIKEEEEDEEEEVVYRPKNIKKQKIKKEIRKRATLTKNSKFAAIVSNKYSLAIIDEKGREILFHEGREATGKITILDVKGKIIFEKEMPKNRWIHYEPLISENIEHIAIFTVNEFAFPDDPEGRDMIHVFDKNGKEILVFPTEEEYGLGYRASYIPLAISPNGRYLAIRIEKLDKTEESLFLWKDLTRFYDLKKKTFWDIDKRYIVYEITNDGIAKLGYQIEPDKIIDLKQYLRK